MKIISVLSLSMLLLHFTARAQQKEPPKTTVMEKDITILLCFKWHAAQMEAGDQRQPMEQAGNGSAIEFKKDGTVIDTDPGGKETTGKWKYDAATKKLTISGDGQGAAMTVKTLTDKELVLETNDPTMGTIGIVFEKAEVPKKNIEGL